MKGDLISRNKVLKIIHDSISAGQDYKTTWELKKISDAIENLPCAYDVDHVIEQFEDQQYINSHDLHEPEWNRGINQAIDIVRSGWNGSTKED